MGRAALLAIFLVPLAVCSAWTIYAGKDLNWDLLNYHYYLPYELLGGRLQQDFFAASAQSYLNPVGYLPFYLMVSAGWHSVIVSLVLAAAHGLSISLLWLLAWRIFAHLPRKERVTFSFLATALGAASAVFWMTVGTSFLDPLLVPPMLGGLLLLAGDGERAMYRATCAGALFGFAAALKYSNMTFVLAALPLALTMPRPSGVARISTAVAFLAGAVLAIVALAGPWMGLLWREFGNPVFPLFNAWFRSPDALPINLVGTRFVPEDWVAVLAFPFRMALLDRSVYLENFAPDLRFAAIVVIASLSAVTPRRSLSTTPRLSEHRMLAFLALGYVLWMVSSANGRYGMVLLLVVGICLAGLVARVLPIPIARVTLGTLLVVQLVMQITAAPARWIIAAPWSRHWLAYDVPERAKRDPALYLTVEILTMSAVIPRLHPESSFVNVRGQHTLPANSQRLLGLIRDHYPHIRTLGVGLQLSDGSPNERFVRAYDATLGRIGFRVDTQDCFTIAWHDADHDWLSRAANWVSRPSERSESLSLVSCALLPASRDPHVAVEEQRISAIFDRIERACPTLLRGQTAITEQIGDGWARNYSGLDARLEAAADRIVLNRYRRGQFIELGPRSAWEGDGSHRPARCRE